MALLSRRVTAYTSLRTQLASYSYVMLYHTRKYLPVGLAKILECLNRDFLTSLQSENSSKSYHTYDLNPTVTLRSTQSNETPRHDGSRPGRYSGVQKKYPLCTACRKPSRQERLLAKGSITLESTVSSCDQQVRPFQSDVRYSADFRERLINGRLLDASVHTDSSR